MPQPDEMPEREVFEFAEIYNDRVHARLAVMRGKEQVRGEYRPMEDDVFSQSVAYLLQRMQERIDELESQMRRLSTGSDY